MGSANSLKTGVTLVLSQPRTPDTDNTHRGHSQGKTVAEIQQTLTLEHHFLHAMITSLSHIIIVLNMNIQHYLEKLPNPNSAYSLKESPTSTKINLF